MLLKGYRKRIFRPECNPNFVSVHCIADLEQDIGDVLPYLNSRLGGVSFVADPPSVTFKVHGKLITVHARHMAINALRDEEEADKILAWLSREINEAWEQRAEIPPSFEARPTPRMLDILKLLPKTNCNECGEPTCTVFALRAAEGVKGPADCPRMAVDARRKLEDYLAGFDLEP